MRELAKLDLDAPVTLLAGDNGTGKSTLIETIAQAVGFAAEGGEYERPRAASAGPAAPCTASSRACTAGTSRADGFFLRAESFFNVAGAIDGGGSLATSRSTAASTCTSSRTASRSSRSPRTASAARACTSSTSPRPRSRSPARSPSWRRSPAPPAGGAQFIIATHSPILLACPDARIYELDEDGFRECAYDDLDAVRLTRGFLGDPERYLRAALGD